MRQLFNHITRPNRITLTIYAFFSLIGLTVYVWYFSFIWEFVFSVTHYIVGLLIAMFIGFLLTVKIDNKFKMSIKPYFIISIVQLLTIWVVSNPIRTWQINSSLDKARLIINPLDTYKQQFNTYPRSLTELKNELNHDLPERTNIGTFYSYELLSEKDYRLSFQSYYGYTTYYNKEKDEWIFMD